MANNIRVVPVLKTAAVFLQLKAVAQCVETSTHENVRLAHRFEISKQELCAA